MKEINEIEESEGEISEEKIRDLETKRLRRWWMAAGSGQWW